MDDTDEGWTLKSRVTDIPSHGVMTRTDTWVKNPVFSPVMALSTPTPGVRATARTRSFIARYGADKTLLTLTEFKAIWDDAMRKDRTLPLSAGYRYPPEPEDPVKPRRMLNAALDEVVRLGERLSASWEHLPCITAGLPRPVDPDAFPVAALRPGKRWPR